MRAVGWSLSHCSLLAGSHAVDKGTPSRLMHCRSLPAAPLTAHRPRALPLTARRPAAPKVREEPVPLLPTSRDRLQPLLPTSGVARSRQAALSPRAGAGGARGGGAGRGLSRRRGQEEEEAEEEGARPPGTAWARHAHGSRTAPALQRRGVAAELMAEGCACTAHAAAPPQPHRTCTALRTRRTRVQPHRTRTAHAPHRTRTAPYTHRACPAPGELVALVRR